MRAYRVSTRKTSGKSIRTAVTLLRAGAIVAFPTETVYGLCVDPSNPRAVERLYRLKGRDASKACAHLIGSRADIESLVPRLPPPADRLADAFWPGPLTLVVPGADGGTIGLRFSSIPLARALPRAFGGPLLQTSANRSGEPAALNAPAIVKSLGGGVDLVLDAGLLKGGVASTVVSCEGPTYRILREGAIPAAEIEQAASERILIVCTGNICRSPLAEVMLRDSLAVALGMPPADLSRHAFTISSAGTAGWEGSPATPQAKQVAAALGFDLRDHAGRICTPELLGASHRVWAMTRAHLAELRNYFQDRPDALELFDPSGQDVPDPFRRSRRVYRKVAEQIQSIVEQRVRELVPGLS